MNRLHLIIGFICHTIVVYIVPVKLWRFKYIEKAIYALLPYAGYWAYRE